MLLCEFVLFFLIISCENKVSETDLNEYKEIMDIRLEIGFGMGDFLFDKALSCPNVGFIGCEIFENGVASLLNKIIKYKISNLRIHFGNCLDLIYNLNLSTLNEIYVLFPDPWPKNRHAKRRLITSDFLIKLHNTLKENSEIHIATDSTIYVRFILNSIHKCKDYFLWVNQSKTNLGIKDYFDIETKYYKKAINSQRKPSLFILRKL